MDIDRIREKLRSNVESVESRLLEACRRAGRPRSDVTLVAVTKTVSAEIARLLPSLGLYHLGENRPQELARKAAQLPTSIQWHMIGHLQRNKIDKTLPLASLIHSVDSLRLLEALEQEAARQGRKVPVLLEVNASGETSKHGFGPGDLAALVPVLKELNHLEVRGLMTMAALQDAEACRPTFRLLRQLREELRSRLAGPHIMTELSMGMSNDFEVAVEEGATYVRLGSVLFQGLPGKEE